MSLREWSENRWLKRHQTSAQEVQRMLAAVDGDLADAAKDLSPDWRFAIGYNAALRLCSVLLYVSGYEAERSQKHYRTIAALPLVLGPENADLSEYLDKCRVRRSEITYETMGKVSASEANDLLAEVDSLKKSVLDWLTANHPSLTG